jgi:cytochrome P450
MARRRQDGEGDLVNAIAQAKLSGTREGLDEAVSLLLGSEPLAISIAWTLHLLSTRPDIQDAIDAELNSATKGLDHLDAQNLSKLRVLRAAVKESMRLCPPTYWIQRQARDDDVIDGLRIRRGSLVVLLLHQIHRHEPTWHNPSRFLPERFLSNADEMSTRSAWMPFGLGPRLCVAREFCMLQAQLTVALVVSRYRIAPGSRQPVLDATVNLRPRRGVRLTLSPR